MFEREEFMTFPKIYDIYYGKKSKLTFGEKPMNKVIFVLLFATLILWGCSHKQPDIGKDSTAKVIEEFDVPSETLIQHPSWASREADFFLQDGVWKLEASGTRISETWKTYANTLPPDQDWSVSVDVTVPHYWDNMEKEEAQVGAGVFVGKVDQDEKSRTVYETNLAAIAQEIRFVQGQLIKNRLGDDPIAVGFMKTDKETANLKIEWDSRMKQIRFFMDGILVDTKHIDKKGIDDWKMDQDKFYVGVMGFAENTDITGHFPCVDNFKITFEKKLQLPF
jgi:hypothetical protein